MIRACGSARGRTLPEWSNRRSLSGPTLARRPGRLAALPCDLVWATTWEEEANAEIAPRIGLPRLPVVTWPETSGEHEREDRWFGLCWKTRTLVTWAAGRSFAWVDDEITDADRTWVSTHHSGRALLHHVEPFRGLTNEDIAVLDRWLRAPCPRSAKLMAVAKASVGVSAFRSTHAAVPER
ncbi:hypothetical protein GCM10027203_45120 [Nonomuraea fastidiosa]|jgi:hypothetical protein